MFKITTANYLNSENTSLLKSKVRKLQSVIPIISGYNTRVSKNNVRYYELKKKKKKKKKKTKEFVLLIPPYAVLLTDVLL